MDAYNNAGGTGRLKEFAHDEEELDLEEKYGQIADKLHTALHEVIGHASGQLNEGVGQPKETLKKLCFYNGRRTCRFSWFVLLNGS